MSNGCVTWSRKNVYNSNWARKYICAPVGSAFSSEIYTGTGTTINIFIMRDMLSSNNYIGTGGKIKISLLNIAESSEVWGGNGRKLNIVRVI